MSINNQIQKRQKRAEKLKQSIQALQNEQPEYKSFDAGVSKPLRLIEPIDRLRLGNMLDELEHLTNLFPEKLINEKLLRSRDDFLDAIKSNLIRRASMSLRGAQDTLNFTLEYLSSLTETQQPKKNIIFSRIMSKQEMVTALGLPSVYKLNQLNKAGIYEIKPVGDNRQNWQIRIDKLDDSLQKKLRP